MHMHESEMNHFVFPIEIQNVLAQSEQDFELSKSEYILLDSEEFSDYVLYQYIAVNSNRTAEVYVYFDADNMVRVIFDADQDTEKQCFKSLSQFVTLN